MNDSELHVADSIKQWVWSGFHAHDDIEQRINDIVDDDCDNVGYPQSDGYSDVAEAVADAPDGHYTAYCFYHGQDVERAVKGYGMMLAFGGLGDDDARGRQAGGPDDCRSAARGRLQGRLGRHHENAHQSARV